MLRPGGDDDRLAARGQERQQLAGVVGEHRLQQRVVRRLADRPLGGRSDGVDRRGRVHVVEEPVGPVDEPLRLAHRERLRRARPSTRTRCRASAARLPAVGGDVEHPRGLPVARDHDVVRRIEQRVAGRAGFGHHAAILYTSGPRVNHPIGSRRDRLGRRPAARPRRWPTPRTRSPPRGSSPATWSVESKPDLTPVTRRRPRRRDARCASTRAGPARRRRPRRGVRRHRRRQPAAPLGDRPDRRHQELRPRRVGVGHADRPAGRRADRGRGRLRARARPPVVGGAPAAAPGPAPRRGEARACRVSRRRRPLGRLPGLLLAVRLGEASTSCRSSSGCCGGSGGPARSATSGRT